MQPNKNGYIVFKHTTSDYKTDTRLNMLAFLAKLMHEMVEEHGVSYLDICLKLRMHYCAINALINHYLLERYKKKIPLSFSTEKLFHCFSLFPWSIYVIVNCNDKKAIIKVNKKSPRRSIVYIKSTILDMIVNYGERNNLTLYGLKRKGLIGYDEYKHILDNKRISTKFKYSFSKSANRFSKTGGTLTFVFVPQKQKYSIMSQ